MEAFEGDVVAATALPLLHRYTALSACKRAYKPIVFHRALHPLNTWGFDRPMIYRAICDVFAYPSRYESFGIAFAEAWAAGKPVVGCKAGAVSSVVNTAWTAYWCRWIIQPPLVWPCCACSSPHT